MRILQVKYIFTSFVVLFFMNTAILQAQSAYDNAITKEEAKQFLTKLYTDMQALHPNLYQYITKEDYDKVYDELLQSLDTVDFYSPNKLYSVLTKFEAFCRDGHSGVYYEVPRKSKLNKKNKNNTIAPIERDPTLKVFPFIFNILKGKMYVNYHCFGSDTIPIKSEIVSIGKETTQEWLQKQRIRISGERDEFRDSQLNRIEYLWHKAIEVDSCRFGYIPYGSQDTLYKTLDCRSNYGEFTSCNRKHLDEPGWFRDNNIKEHLTFRAVDDGRIGIIFMRKFFPVKKMLPLINKALDSLKFHGVEDLIIDLRKSPGGHAESGYALIDRITDKHYCTDSEEHFFVKSAMLTSNNKWARNIWTSRKYLNKNEIKTIMETGRDTIITYQYSEITPKKYKNKFTGNIWVLTGANTFSAAVGVAAIIQDCKLGTVVGEETGGIPNTFGNPMYYPLTGVMDEKILKFYYIAPYIKNIRPSGDDSMKLRGVIPDIEIEPNIMLNEDTQLQTLIEIIKKQRK